MRTGDLISLAPVAHTVSMPHSNPATIGNTVFTVLEVAVHIGVKNLLTGHVAIRELHIGTPVLPAIITDCADIRITVACTTAIAV